MRQAFSFAQAFRLLSAQAVQIPPQLRGPRFGAGGEAARTRLGPKSALSDISALDIALIHPIPLGLAEALLELGASRLPALRDQLLVHPVEIGVVLYDRAIQTGTLIDRGGRITRIT